ncbi:MAG: hypothetical protein V1744_03530, partial [Candidatus Altiarchaeota archaeon]
THTLYCMYYEDVFKALNNAGVDYLVVGGVALVLHGVVRMTVDLDLVVDESEANLEKFVSAVEKLGYKPKVPVKLRDFVDEKKRRQWVVEKNMKVFSVYNPKAPYMIVDVLLDGQLDYPKLKRDRIVVDAGGIKVPVVSIKHLKELKLLSGRVQDVMDVKSLDELEDNEK